MFIMARKERINLFGDKIYKKSAAAVSFALMIDRFRRLSIYSLLEILHMIVVFFAVD